MRDVFVGMGLGFVVAVQLGPMSAWIISSTLRAGFAIGAAMSAGVALIDLAYATVGVSGVAAALRSPTVARVAGLLGAAVVAWLGLAALRAARHPDVTSGRAVPANPVRAFGLSLAATAVNPATIGSWAAIFAGLGTSGHNLPALVAGVGLGTLVWLTTLSGVISVIRRGLSRRGFQLADALSGACMLVLAGVLAVRAFAA